MISFTDLASALRAIALLFATTLIVRGLVIAIYRWKFHPLAKYPGPWLAKITDLYGVYHSARGQDHLANLRAHERFGPIVRTGPNKLTASGTTFFHELYTSKQVQKSQAYAMLTPTPGAFNLHTCIDRMLHRHKRKIVGQAYTEQAIRDFEPTIIDNVSHFLDAISEAAKGPDGKPGWSSPLDMSLLCKYLSVDVMGSLGFGQSFNLLRSTENRFIVPAMKASGFIAGLYAQYPRLKQLGLGDLVKITGGWTRARFGKVAKNLMETRLEEGKHSKKDLFSFLIDAQNPENGRTFSLDELWAESWVVMRAGSDSVAATMAATFFYLSRNPQCYQKLVSAIRGSFLSEDEITRDSLNSCQYLRACIDETMRMSPPIAAVMPREVLDPGATFDGNYIPPGVVIGCSIYTIHHDESIFPESFTYNPDRWIESEKNPADRIERQRWAFRPFSLGTRDCVAKSMAYTELLVAIARTLWHFDIRRPSGPLDAIGAGAINGPEGRQKTNEFQIWEHVTAQSEGPCLEFRSRLRV